MREERRKVLEMLAAGQVTPDQADQLLEAMGDTSAPAGWQGQRPPSPVSNGDDVAPSRPAPQRLTMQDLIRLHDHGVDADYIRELRQLGLTDLSINQIIELSNHGVDPDFIMAMRRLGFSNLPLDQLINLANHGVDPDYIQEMRALGLTDLSADQLIELQNHGVDPDFVREMQSMQEQPAQAT